MQCLRVPAAGLNRRQDPSEAGIHNRVSLDVVVPISQSPRRARLRQLQVEIGAGCAQRVPFQKKKTILPSARRVVTEELLIES